MNVKMFGPVGNAKPRMVQKIEWNCALARLILGHTIRRQFSSVDFAQRIERGFLNYKVEKHNFMTK